MPKPDRNALGIRLAIVAVGMTLGFALRWIVPPSNQVMFDDVEQGTLRARAAEQERADNSAINDSAMGTATPAP